MKIFTRILAIFSTCFCLSTYADEGLVVHFKSLQAMQTYILIKGIDPKTGKACFIQFDFSHTPALATYVDASSQTDSRDYTYALNRLPIENNLATLHLPHLTSGRIYFSYGTPLQRFSIVKDAAGQEQIADPSVYNPTDSNYNTLFDKVEFTYLDNGKTWVNPTAVDFVALPLTIQQHGRTYGLTVSQQTLDNVMSAAFENDSDYHNLIRRQANGHLLRILAPGRDDGSFSSNYLENTIEGYWQYYSTHTMTIDCSEVKPNDPLFSGRVSGDTLVLKNQTGWKNTPSTTQCDANDSDNEVCIQQPSSDEFFQGAGPNLANKGAVPISVVSKFISSAWASGLLPTTSTLNTSFFKAQQSHYFQQGSYDLYDKALHSNNMGILYGFAYDDVLGIDGTNGSSDQYPITITLNQME